MLDVAMLMIFGIIILKVEHHTNFVLIQVDTRLKLYVIKEVR